MQTSRKKKKHFLIPSSIYNYVFRRVHSISFQSFPCV